MVKRTRVLKQLLAGIPVLACATLYALHAGAAGGYSTTYQANPAHSGYVPVTLNPADFALRWQVQVGGTKVLNSVTAAAGKVYVTQDGYFDNPGLYVLSAATGDLLWNLNFGSVRSVNPPSYAYGNVYIQTGNHSSDTYFRAYNAETVAELFSSPHSAQWEEYFAPTIDAGTVFVNGGYFGGMYAFDAFSGHNLWFNGDLPQYDKWTPTLDQSTAYAYLGDYSPGLYAIDREKGELQYRIDDPEFTWNGWSMNEAVVLGGYQDAVAINGGRLLSFDLQARAIRWTLAEGFTGQAAIARDVIYAISSGGLVALEEATGNSLWRWSPTDKLIDAPIVTNNHVFVRSSRSVYAVNLQTHTPVWSYPASGPMTLSGGTLYLAGQSGLLTAIAVRQQPESTVDLSVAVAASTVRVGDPLTFSVVVSNQGVNGASDVGVSFVLPPTAEIQSAISTRGACNPSPGQVSCSIRSLPAGSKAIVTVIAFVTTAGTITSSATVAGNEIDTDPANNAASLETVVIPGKADLSIQMTANQLKAIVGVDLTYELIVSNGGPNNATEVMLEDVLPANASFVSATLGTGSCMESGGKVSCAIGRVDAGASATASIVVRPTSTQAMKNIAYVWSESTDPDPKGNIAALLTPVQPSVTDLLLTEVETRITSVKAGGLGLFRVTDSVANGGNVPTLESSTGYLLQSAAAGSSTIHLLVGKRNVVALEPGSSSKGGTLIAVPATVPPGSYFLVACADGPRQIAEVNENNNCKAAPTLLEVVQ